MGHGRRQSFVVECTKTLFSKHGHKAKKKKLKILLSTSEQIPFNFLPHHQFLIPAQFDIFNINLVFPLSGLSVRT